jgi:hypothetical protein
VRHVFAAFTGKLATLDAALRLENIEDATPTIADLDFAKKVLENLVAAHNPPLQREEDILAVHKGTLANYRRFLKLLSELNRTTIFDSEQEQAACIAGRPEASVQN